MKPLLSPIVSVLIFLSFSLHLHADWEWENDSAIANPTAKGYEAKLVFINKGNREVTVTGLNFSCPCTIATFSATTAKPGKSGILIIIVKAEKPETGEHDLDVIVTGTPDTKPKELTLRLQKPEKVLQAN